MLTQRRLITSAFIALFGLLLLPVTSIVQAQTVQESTAADSMTVTVEGEVLNAYTDQPVSGITVTIVGENKSAESDNEGKFTFNNLNPGTYTFEINNSEFEMLSQEVEITTQDDENKNLTLKLIPKY